jgi:hypothetical protein
LHPVVVGIVEKGDNRIKEYIPLEEVIFGAPVI